MNTCLVYLTAADTTEADQIVSAVLDEKLAACANIFDGIRSVFRWQGKLCRETECAVLLKTTEPCREKLIRRITELHSYDCPCILSVPVDAGNPAFLTWIEETCGKKEE